MAVNDNARILRIGLVSVSDRAARGVYEDAGLPALEQWLQTALRSPYAIESRLIPDEQALIESTLIELVDTLACDLVLTTGGTGPAPRDVTPEATRQILDRELPGIAEAMRAVSFAKTPTAILSRAVAGTRGRSLVINLPGNPRAIGECLPPLASAIAEAIFHLRNVRVRLKRR